MSYIFPCLSSFSSDVISIFIFRCVVFVVRCLLCEFPNSGLMLGLFCLLLGPLRLPFLLLPDPDFSIRNSHVFISPNLYGGLLFCFFSGLVCRNLCWSCICGCGPLPLAELVPSHDDSRPRVKYYNAQNFMSPRHEDCDPPRNKINTLFKFSSLYATPMFVPVA